MDLTHWVGALPPQREDLDGQYVRLEPLDSDAHAAELYQSSAAPGSDERFRYMAEQPPTDQREFYEWVARAAQSKDPLFFAVVDQKSGRAEGRQSLMRVDSSNGVIEVGNIVWGPNLARTRGATEALFLFADYVFGLGYRRLEWKCNALNEPSKRAALRFGFVGEGTFRQHMVVKGLNRDTAWFSITDEDWPHLRKLYAAWLAPENFRADGQQVTSLATR